MNSALLVSLAGFATISGDVLNRYLATGSSARYVNAGMGALILLTAVYILLG